MHRFNKIICAMIKNGCAKVKNGCAMMKNGYTKVKNGCVKIKNGCAMMKNGCAKVKNGCTKVKNGCTKVKNGCTKVKNGYFSLFFAIYIIIKLNSEADLDGLHLRGGTHLALNPYSYIPFLSPLGNFAYYP